MNEERVILAECTIFVDNELNVYCETTIKSKFKDEVKKDFNLIAKKISAILQKKVNEYF